MKTFLKSFGSVLLVFCILFSLYGCTVPDKKSASMTLNSDIFTTECNDTGIHKFNESKKSLTAASGLIKLYYDSDSTSVAVYDTSAEAYWTALPLFDTESASVLNVVLRTDKGRFYLNSQDNSVAYSSYSTEFDENGLTVSYCLSDNAETALKAFSEINSGDVYISVPLSIHLVDGSLEIAINKDDIKIPEDCIIESITVLPFFGAVSYSDNSIAAEKKLYGSISSDSSGDFILVPDGCGAVMYTKQEDSSTERISFSVYGSGNNDDEYTAQIPAFGIKKGSSAFVAVIGEGAEYATVKASRGSTDINGFNKVSSEFAVMRVDEDGDRLLYDNEITGSIELCYRFMSGSEANYISMASSCREYLIRTGILSSRTVDEQTPPVNISVISTVDGSYSTVASDFDEIEDMLSVIKAKGIDSANIILQGIFGNGIIQSYPDKLTSLKKCGGSGALDSLTEYAKKQNFDVFAGVNILTAADESDSAETLTGEKLTAYIENPLSPYIGNDRYGVNLIKADGIDKSVISVLNSSKNYDFSGFCINDAAGLLYSDYSEDERINLSAAADIIAENVSAFAIQKELILNGCNFYAIKDASDLLDVPFYTQYAETEAYEAVPFIPAILHSSVYYSGTPVNSAELPKLEMLKYAEYGAVPYFQWVVSMKSHLCYGLNIAENVEFIQRISSELGDLASCRISGHSKIEDGVYMTSYDSGSVVYVNYNNYSVNIGNISVLPYDFMRLN